MQKLIPYPYYPQSHVLRYVMKEKSNMDAQQIIEYIRTSEKKTPVKVYVWEKSPVAFSRFSN